MYRHFPVHRSMRYFRCFFFNDPATTEIYTLSLHDALPISDPRIPLPLELYPDRRNSLGLDLDRKSTRLNSSYSQISYAVFCLKKKSADYILHRVSTVNHEVHHDLL